MKTLLILTICNVLRTYYLTTYGSPQFGKILAGAYKKRCGLKERALTVTLVLKLKKKKKKERSQIWRREIREILVKRYKISVRGKFRSIVQHADCS